MKHLPGILCDEQIRHLCEQHENPMIYPFVKESVREQPAGKVISYGLSSFGYDMRAAPEWKLFTNINTAIVDPKRMDSASFVERRSDTIIIPPNSFVLTRSVERFSMPDDVIAIVLGKSTYARCGLAINCTPMEPGWTGYLTIEISNTTPNPARVYANEGIAQALFFRGTQAAATSYAARDGKYMDQPAKVVISKV